MALGLGVSTVWFSSGSDSSAKSQDPKVVFEELKKQASEAMKSPRAIDASLERNPNSFACLFSADGVCAGRGGSFQFFEDISAQPISQLMRDMGTNPSRIGCKGFPSVACPLRVEAIWIPVCADNRCENTKSFKVKMKVIYNAGLPGEAEEWSQEDLYSPPIKITEGIACARGGGVWAGTECLSPAQASERNIASNQNNGVIAPNGMNESQIRQEEVQMGGAGGGPEPTCPNQIQLQSQYWSLEMLSPGRGQVRMPAVNGCPAEDYFTFQCMPKVPAEFEGEGQWIQVEASMAPTCDSAGNPIDPVLRE